MPRAQLVRSTDLPYHVSARSNNREWFYQPPFVVWQIFCECLAEVCRDYTIRVHAFVLMSNHYHLVVSTPLGNLGDAMNHLQREVSREINRRSHRINHVFGGPYSRTLITTDQYLWNVFRYVFRNPVEAKLASSVETYRFSTLRYQMRDEALPFEIAPLDPIFDMSALLRETSLEWFNHSFAKGERECIEKGLRRSTFQIVSRRREPVQFTPMPQR